MLQAFRRLNPAHDPMDRMHGNTVGTTAYIGVDFYNSPVGFVLDSSHRGHWWDSCIPVGLSLSQPCGNPLRLNFAQTVEIQTNRNGPVIVERTMVGDHNDAYKPVKMKYIHLDPGLRVSSITNLPMTMKVHRTVENNETAQVIDPRTQLLSLSLDVAHNQTSWVAGYHDRLYEAVSLLDGKYKPFRHYTKHSFGRKAPQEDLTDLVWELYGFAGREKNRPSVDALLRKKILPVMPSVDPEALRNPYQERSRRSIAQRMERPIIHPDVGSFCPVDKIIDDVGITDYTFRPAMMDAIQLFDQIPMSDWDARYISLDGYSVQPAHFVGCRYYGGLFNTDIRVETPPDELGLAVQEYLAQVVAISLAAQDEETLCRLRGPLSIRVYRRNTEDIFVCIHVGQDAAPDKKARPLYSAYYFLPLLSLVNMGIAYKEDYTTRNT